MGFPLEILTLVGSGLLSGVMTLWGMSLKAKAQQQGLRCNTHIYGVDDEYYRYWGGFLTYKNTT